jgi:Arc/MetJ-type ribon-helix-helix transcriptional regulator
LLHFGQLASMKKAQPLTITLLHDMLEMVKAKVALGEYATESLVIRDSLRILQARDAAVDNSCKS